MAEVKLELLSEPPLCIVLHGKWYSVVMANLDIFSKSSNGSKLVLKGFRQLLTYEMALMGYKREFHCMP